MKSFIIASLLLFWSSVVFAQNLLRGKVTDQQTGASLPGATIKAGTTVRSATGEGEFELPFAAGTETMEVSFIGYETRIIKLQGDMGYLNIALVSSNTNLSTVTVTGYETNRRLLETAGSIGVLRAKDLQRGDNMDIMPAMNTIPGVKMEAYSAGNYRISIRGSLINNPWGIRNLRIYWNDIPLSSPDGTALKTIDFDPTIIGSVEVLKGPSGSMYGAGNGGVLLVKNSKAEQGKTTVEAGYTGGSYGFSRLQTAYKSSGENYSIAASIVRQRYDGYRENNWGNKDIVNLFTEFRPNPKSRVSFFATHVTGSLGIAGGLNKSQADSMPTQALQFNKNNKISVKKYEATALGASHSYQFSDLFSNTTSIYGNFQTYDHPFGSSIYYNGYLKESLSGYGARTKFVYSPVLFHIKSRFSIGGEYQFQNQMGNTFSIINDQPGTWPETGDLRQNDIVKSTSKMIFAQAEFDLPANTFLTLGASYNKLSYDILDMFKGAGHVDYSGLLEFPDKISPRVGLVKAITNNISAHASMSFGYSPPPVSQLNNYDGTLNKSIKPEDGTNYELGIRGAIFKTKLNFDITAYQMYLGNAIVPVARPDGTTAYRNAGKTNQKGIEAALSYILFNDSKNMVSFLKPWVSYTFNDYEFTDYKTQSFDWGSSSVVTKDNSGKKVTGVVPNSVSAGIDLDTRIGVYANAICYYYDKSPLNDGNTYYAAAYSLLNIKLGYRKTFNQVAVDISAGINNAFDTQYTSLLLYNADATSGGAAPQFYNPSVGVNYYAGVKIKYSFK